MTRFSCRIGALLVVSTLLSTGAPTVLAAPPSDSTERLHQLRREQRTGSPVPAAELSRRLNDIAAAYLSESRVGEAIELLGEAVTVDPENGPALANLTLAYVRSGDYEFAEFYLRQARENPRRVSPRPEVYSVLGNAYAAANRVEDAIEAWEEARSLGDDSPGLRRRIEQARTEWAYAHGQKFYSGERFSFVYDPVITDRDVALADSSLETSVDALSDFFFSPPPDRIIVILYAGRRYFHLLETPDWVAGFFDGKIRVPVEPGTSETEAFAGLLRHELAHAFLHRLSRGRAPSWLQEGLAQYVEGRRVGVEEIRRLGVTNLARFLEDSEQDFHQRVDREKARRAYMLSLSYVQSLIRSGGAGAVVCLAAELGEGRGFAESFRQQLGADSRELEAAWRKELETPGRDSKTRE